MSDTTPSNSSSAPSSTAATDRHQPPRMQGGDLMFMILLTLFEIGASILVVHQVKAHGGSDFAAYMWAMLPPLIGSVAYWLRTRELSGASMAIVAFNLLSAGVAAIGSHDSKMLLYKDCFATAIIGVVFLASIFIGKPVTYYYGERFAAGTDPARIAWWRSLWQFKVFRMGQYQTCVLWAVIMFLEAGSKALVISRSSFSTAYAWDQVLPIAATAVGVVGTIVLARRSQRIGLAQAAAHEERMRAAAEQEGLQQA